MYICSVVLGICCSMLLGAISESKFRLNCVVVPFHIVSRQVHFVRHGCLFPFMGKFRDNSFRFLVEKHTK
jgi:hypothetical protein